MKKTRAAVKLSIEIIEIIIDYLQGHPYSLQRCSRVSRAWLPRSRFHLFRKIHLDYQHECKSLYAIVRKSPHIASLIQEVHIREGHNFKSENDWMRTTPSLRWFLDKLTNLAVLSFRCDTWDEERFTPELKRVLHRVVRSNPIASLAFKRCFFPFQWIRKIVQSCRRLKCLELQGCSVQCEEDLMAVIGEVLAVFPHTIQLDDLRIDNQCRRFLFPMNPITGPESGFDLRHLHTLHCDDSYCFQTLLDSMGGSLRHLVLRACNASWPGCLHQDKGVNCLERNTGLQSLRVSGIVDLGHDAIPWLTSLLRSASALQLKEVAMDFFPAKWMETVYWNRIDEVFEDNAFPELTKVDIDFVICRGSPYPPPSQKEISANASSQFPRLHRRKILKVTPISGIPGL